LLLARPVLDVEVDAVAAVQRGPLGHLGRHRFGRGLRGQPRPRVVLLGVANASYVIESSVILVRCFDGEVPTYTDVGYSLTSLGMKFCTQVNAFISGCENLHPVSFLSRKFCTEVRV
jgi:hypothetical protein